MQIDAEIHRRKKSTLVALERDRLPWWQHWRTLADYYLPRRYVWLLSGQERKRALSRNEFILDGTGTMAARTLASGMMNGVTSPSRPWFKLRASGFDDEIQTASRVWLDEVARRMLLAMAETNFYNAMAILYLDLSVFGTAAALIYEDYEDVFRFYSSPLGEFYLAQSDRQQVNHFARQFCLKVHQVVQWWGLENCTVETRAKFQEGGPRLQDEIDIVHLIEPNIDKDRLKGNYEYREYYWEKPAPDGQMLAANGFKEFPGIFPRWELCANDSYGSSPAMDALGDVIQLQLETKRKAQGLDKMVSPPIIADIQLQHRPIALLPNGVTFATNIANSVGAKPIYTVQLPLDQLTADIQDVQGRIRETFHNDLFRMISQLDTVRSATEIDARREEKLVLLGPVLERFENEALDPAIKRVFAIMDRAGLLPEAPEEIKGANIEIQYVSVLTSAQTAVAAIPTERFLAMIGQVAAVYPKALNIPNFEELLRNYGRDIGVRAKDIRTTEETDAVNKAQDEALQSQQDANQGNVLVNSAKTLSETDVGGGANALQKVLGN